MKTVKQHPYAKHDRLKKVIISKISNEMKSKNRDSRIETLARWLVVLARRWNTQMNQYHKANLKTEMPYPNAADIRIKFQKGQ